MSTYSQIYIQVVFSVKARDHAIKPEWEEELYRYISGTINKKGQKLLAINGMPDHIHILINMQPNCCLSDLVREIKKSSNIFIKEKGWIKENFEWQEGFGAFSYSQSALENVISYIQKQKDHHKKTTFKEEYTKFLEKFNIDHNNKYL